MREGEAATRAQRGGGIGAIRQERVGSDEQIARLVAGTGGQAAEPARVQRPRRVLCVSALARPRLELLRRPHRVVHTSLIKMIPETDDRRVPVLDAVADARAEREALFGGRQTVLPVSSPNRVQRSHHVDVRFGRNVTGLDRQRQRLAEVVSAQPLEARIPE